MGMSERGCADACGCGCKGKDGNVWGEGSVGMSEGGCADVRGLRGRKGKGHERARMCGCLPTVWVKGKGGN